MQKQTRGGEWDFDLSELRDAISALVAPGIVFTVRRGNGKRKKVEFDEELTNMKLQFILCKLVQANLSSTATQFFSGFLIMPEDS